MRRLIVNADDFGLTAGVNDAVLELNAAGALTSTTLMATAREFPAAVTSALLAAKREFSQAGRPPLGVGCHVVLVDGTPCMPPEQIPTLMDPAAPQGVARFRRTLGRFVIDLMVGRIREADIEAEALAQIRRLQQAGVQPTHVDTHKHTHMFAGVLRPLLRAATVANVGAIRNPFEPAWSLAATAGAARLRQLEVRILRSQKSGFLAAVRQQGIATTDGAVGVLATGILNSTTLHSLLAAMPEGTWELVTHPGHHDIALDRAGTRLLVSREVERGALLEVLPAAIVDKNIELIHFGHLTEQVDSQQTPHAEPVGEHATS